MGSIQMKGVSEGAVMGKESEFLHGIKRDLGTLVFNRDVKLFGAEAKMRMHHRAGCWNSGKLAAWSNKIEWPDNARSEGNKHGTVECEIQFAIRALLKSRPRRSVYLLLFWSWWRTVRWWRVLKGDRGPRECRIDADQSA